MCEISGKYILIILVLTRLIQGEALSPFLFSLSVNDLEMGLLNNTERPFQLNMLHLCFRMYADDTVLFSESVSALLSMLDT